MLEFVAGLVSGSRREEGGAALRARAGFKS